MLYVGGQGALDNAHIQHESTVASLKKKHQDATSEMAEQVDQLNKMRGKVEKEKHAKNLQIEEVRAAMDLVANERATLEKQNRLLEQQRLEVGRRAEESNLTLSDYDNSRKKVVVENAELLPSIEELENNNSVLGKLKQTLTAQLSEVTKMGDNEAKERQFLLGKYRNLEHEVDLTKGQLEEEGASKNDALRLLSKSVGDSQMWRQKYEKEGLAKAEEAESAKLKLQSRLAEAEGCVSNLNGRRPSCRLRLRKLSLLLKMRKPVAWRWKRRPVTLTKLSPNGRTRLKAFNPSWTRLRWSAEATRRSCSR